MLSSSFLWLTWYEAWEKMARHSVIASGQGWTLSFSHSLGFWIHAGDFCLGFLSVVVRATASLLPASFSLSFLSCRSVVLPPGAGATLPHSNWLPKFWLPLSSPWPGGPNCHSYSKQGAAESAAGGWLFFLLSQPQWKITMMAGWLTLNCTHLCLSQEQEMLYQRSTGVDNSTFDQPDRHVKLWVKLVTPFIKNFFWGATRCKHTDTNAL